MDFSHIIEQLFDLNRGWTFESIGSEVGTSGMTIRRLYNGVTIDPHFSVGNGLIELLKEEKRKKR